MVLIPNFVLCSAQHSIALCPKLLDFEIFFNTKIAFAQYGKYIGKLLQYGKFTSKIA